MSNATLAQLVEQHFCKVTVVGPNPTGGSKGRYRSGQTGQTVNLLAHAFAGSNPARPTQQKIAYLSYFFVTTPIQLGSNQVRAVNSR